MGDDDRRPDGTWKTGVSGNPEGRPRRLSLAAALRNKLREAAADGKTYLDAVVVKTLKDALEGDSASMKLVWNYCDGKAPQALSITGGDGPPIQHVDLGKLDPDQLKALYVLLELAESPDEE